MVRSFLATLLAFIFLTTTVPAAEPDGSEYLSGKDSKVGVILSHGQGGVPTSHVVDPLRKAINEELGFHTLSLQLPNGRSNWKQYKADFPDAYKIFAEGIKFLREEKGVKTIYLMGYSMGGRMATAFLANNPDSGIAGYIGVGTRNGNGTGGVLDSLANLLKAPVLPIMDVWGTGGDGKDAKHATKRARLSKRGPYSKAVINGAPHNYKGYNKEVADPIIAWLKSRG